jgi:5-methylcytosine-specific restriction endonuclease McrA
MSREELPLPPPDSADLNQILRVQELRRIYAYLYGRRNNPPTQVEIEAHLAEITGQPASQRGRRVRELYPFFWIDKTPGRRPGYILTARKPVLPDEDPIDDAKRARVLQPGRCAMCGKTPLEDGVKLVVDHKIPKEWGGTNDDANLQPLCEQCNNGKKNHFKSYDPFVEQIRLAATHDEPQKRVGELLKAFGTNEWVRSDVLAIVANAKDYQEDWQRRLRDLRYIGWKFTVRTRREGGRVWSYYRLTQSASWPDNIIAAVKAEYDRRQRERLKANG